MDSLKGINPRKKGLLSSGKSILREGEGAVMDSENHKAVILNVTDNGSEQSTAITRDQGNWGQVYG